MMGTFDYQVIHRCQFDVSGVDCGEPATHKVWWTRSDSVVVCPVHLELMRRREAEVIE